ncbi:hypothetical protein AAVH_27184 [Aphelenchoides avenae]|nr:hypothetical protein AAVH_27184 [Aphelenchus avenae]
MNGLFLGFFEHNDLVAYVAYTLTGYSTYYQFHAHTFISLNRFTVFVFPDVYDTVGACTGPIITCQPSLLDLEPPERQVVHSGGFSHSVPSD